MVADAEELFHEYVRSRLPGLLRIAFLLTGDAHLADDLVQQALIRVASRWERVIAAGDPEPYVRKVLYHQHVSWWRRHRRAELPTEELPDVAVADHTASVAISLAVWQALAALAPRQRAVLILRFYEDLSEARAAEVLGCSVSTVKSQTRDALARLRAAAPDLAEVML
jgi:RNA polymerase sigma-70 factor (sigma-E family)